MFRTFTRTYRLLVNRVISMQLITHPSVKKIVEIFKSMYAYRMFIIIYHVITVPNIIVEESRKNIKLGFSHRKI